MNGGVFLKRGDIIIILLLLAVGLIGLIIYYRTPADPMASIVIQVEGKAVATYPLLEEGRDLFLDIEGVNGITRIHLLADRVRVVESACPDKICVNTGWIWNSAQSIACLPNKVVIKILNAPPENIDLR